MAAWFFVPRSKLQSLTILGHTPASAQAFFLARVAACKRGKTFG